MAKVEYIRCPRCELNYIDKRDKLCKVCQMEMQARGTSSALDEEEVELGICPICKTNYIGEDEEMCAMCQKEKEVEEGLSNQNEDEDNWRMYVENEDQETEEDEVGDMSSITDLDDEMLADDLEMDLDEEDMENEEEEFEEEPEEDADDFDDLDDIDDDDDEDDEYDDDDEDYDDDDDFYKKSKKK